jgi:hypothetical protein
MPTEDAVYAADTLLSLLVTHQPNLVDLDAPTGDMAGTAVGKRAGELIAALREQLIQMYEKTPHA